MLTQDDVRAIGKIFESKLESLETKLNQKIDSLDKRVNSLDYKMNRGFKSVDKKLDVIINYFDHQDIDIRKRVNRIEIHLGLMPLNS